jgi:hypothetical protein
MSPREIEAEISRGYPGLEALARTAFDRARAGLPPDVGIAILLAFHYGDGGGLAWIAGTERDDAISTLVEWLAHQARTGHADAVQAAIRRWFLKEPM